MSVGFRASTPATIGRYAEVPVARMPPDERDAHQALIEGPRGRVSGHFRIWVANAPLVHAVASVDEHINSEAFTLTSREREICILVTAETYGAEYVWAAHERLAKEIGLSDATLKAIRRRDDPGFVDEREVSVYEVAVALHRRTGSLPRPVYDRAIELLGHRGLSDLVAALGYYVSVCFTMNAYCVPPAGGSAAE